MLPVARLDLHGPLPAFDGVIRNQPPDGGFEVFRPVAEQSTFATSLQVAGYRTALMGKYLNGYTPHAVVDGRPRYLPPGWSDWAVAGDAYRGFDYNLLVASPGVAPQTVRYGHRARDYLTDVISRRGRRFVGDAVRPGGRSCSNSRRSPRTTHTRPRRGIAGALRM